MQIYACSDVFIELAFINIFRAATEMHSLTNNLRRSSEIKEMLGKTQRNKMEITMIDQHVSWSLFVPYLIWFSHRVNC